MRLSWPSTELRSRFGTLGPFMGIGIVAVLATLRPPDTLVLRLLAPVLSEASARTPEAPAGTTGAIPSWDAAPASAPAATPEARLATRRARTWRLAQRKVDFAWFNGGSPRRKEVALTFDDGPDPKYTPRVLDILKREGVSATFFVVGAKAKKHPQLIRRMAAEGHDLGNHTYHHFPLATLKPDAVRFEIEETNTVLTGILGGPTRWFRAPGCHYSSSVLKAVADLGMVRVDTTCNSADWSYPALGSILGRTSKHLSPGDILLFHDRLQGTVDALPHVLKMLRYAGYRVVPLTDLALKAQAEPDFRPEYWPADEGITLASATPPYPARSLLPKPRAGRDWVAELAPLLRDAVRPAPVQHAGE